MKLKFYYIIFTLAVLMWSCSDSSDDANAGDPSNLVTDIEISGTNSGLVSMTAFAENAIEYHFDMGDGSEVIINTNGIAEHTYELTGVYQIEIRAYGTSGRFIKEEHQVTIQIGNSDEGYTTPMEYDGFTLIWQDEFTGTNLDQSFWNYEIGTGSNGWGNNELQYYREGNTSVADGYLTIEARQESFGGRSYTSSRLTTQNKFDFKYGRIDIRARLPKGQGIWPALWMLGANFSTVGWPACGETDIMEMIGGNGRENEVHGTCHWDSNGHASYGGGTTLSDGTFNDQFHVFTITWDANSIEWYVDDQQYHVIDTTPGDLSEFQEEFFFIFNVAVGGNWPGSPNSSTQFPQQMVVDYVRVFQPE